MKYVVDVNGSRHDVDVDGLFATTLGVPEPAALGPTDGTPLRLLRIGNRTVCVMARRGEEKGSYTLDLDGHTYMVEALDARTRTIRDMAEKQSSATGPASLKAPMPGLVVRVNIAVGDQVHGGQGLVVMEAMKMENELRTSAAGVVTGVHVTAGTVVEKGTLLIELGELSEM